MKRETIDLSKFEGIHEVCYGENIYDIDTDEIIYKFIESTIINVNLEKSYKTLEIIIQRISDKKYFRFGYDSSDYWEPEYIQAVEVFPKQVTITIYE